MIYIILNLKLNYIFLYSIFIIKLVLALLASVCHYCLHVIHLLWVWSSGKYCFLNQFTLLIILLLQGYNSFAFSFCVKPFPFHLSAYVLHFWTQILYDKIILLCGSYIIISLPFIFMWKIWMYLVTVEMGSTDFGFIATISLYILNYFTKDWTANWFYVHGSIPSSGTSSFKPRCQEEASLCIVSEMGSRDSYVGDFHCLGCVYLSVSNTIW